MALTDPFAEGIDLFNREYFFEAHDVLEEVWMEERGPQRNFYKGLIQIAGGFHHYQNGNYRGSVNLLERGGNYLKAYRPRFHGVDVDALLAAVAEAREKVARLRDGRSEAEDVAFPRIDYEGGSA